MSVSEAMAKRSPMQVGLAALGYLGLAAAAFLMIPVLAGLTFFEVSKELLWEIGIVVGLTAIAFYIQVQSRKGPKNSLQIDYQASEVRLGSITSAGAFVRHKVFSLRAIDAVSVDTSAPSRPALRLTIGSETATVQFSNTEVARVNELAAKVQSAVDEARAAPMRSRIVSRINGVDAGVREVTRRVKSRVTSRFA